MDNNKHVWRFSRVGGVNRVNLDSGQDLMYLDQLDQKLWTALSCPVSGLEIDSKTLELIDVDRDLKIRAPEVIASVKWAIANLKTPDELLKSSKELQLSAINDLTDEGKNLLKSAKQILTNLGKPEQKFITVEETSSVIKIFEKTKFNGDGIITALSSDKAETTKIIEQILSCTTPLTDRSGKPGISKNTIDEFYKICQDYIDWYATGEKDKDKILPIGENTEAGFNIFNKIRNKIDDYFIRCKLANFDNNSTEILNLLIPRYQQITPKDLSACIDEIATYPISKIEANKSFAFKQAINPAWENTVENFYSLIFTPIFGNKETMQELEWNIICDKFDNYKKWRTTKKGENVEKLGLAQIRTLLNNNSKQELYKLVEQDLEQADEAEYFDKVDKLVRFNRDLYNLLRNYVSFVDLYAPNSIAIFQTGTLYIDERSCDLCIKVNDMPKHNTMASMSGIYLVYCDCTSKKRNEKMTIVAAITDGDIDNLMVGRNALFYDRKGDDWEAVITKIIENPISVRQAFWAPYRKIAKLIEKQIEKMASARDAEIEAKASEKITETSSSIDKKDNPAETPTPTPPPVKQPFDMGKFVGVFAAVGLAIGAIGTAIASLVSGLMGLAWWKMPLAILGILLVISGPSMIIGWLKLRKRNLAPVLDANGWAINASVKINIPFGKVLTKLAKLPKNSQITLKDPYTKKQKPILLIVLIILAVITITVLLLNYFNVINAIALFKSWFNL